jgi:DNA-binding transcriptional ArsR family regulator
MPLLDLESYANLSEDDRLDRIGALIAKAVVLYRCDRRRAGKDEPETVAEADQAGVIRSMADLAKDETEKQVIRYLERVGSATPQNFSTTLGLSRQTVSRKLARLRVAGLVVVTGKTRMARYELAGQSSLN